MLSGGDHVVHVARKVRLERKQVMSGLSGVNLSSLYCLVSIVL